LQNGLHPINTELHPVGIVSSGENTPSTPYQHPMQQYHHRILQMQAFQALSTTSSSVATSNETPLSSSSEISLSHASHVRPFFFPPAFSVPSYAQQVGFIPVSFNNGFPSYPMRLQVEPANGLQPEYTTARDFAYIHPNQQYLLDRQPVSSRDVDRNPLKAERIHPLVARDAAYHHSIFPAFNHVYEMTGHHEASIPSEHTESVPSVGNKRSFQEANENGSWIPLPLDIRADSMNAFKAPSMRYIDTDLHEHYVKRVAVSSDREELYTGTVSHKIYDDDLAAADEESSSEQPHSESPNPTSNGKSSTKSKLI
jgi:hypothetical protein